MPHATADDGVKLWYEETGSGTPVISCTSSPATIRSWEPQLRHFGQRYRAIAYNARGYPPSDVPAGRRLCTRRTGPPTTSAPCSTHLAIDRAHVVGLSMGGFATLHFGFRHPPRARSLVRRRLRLWRGARQARAVPRRGRQHRRRSFASTAWQAFAARYAFGPTRVQFQNKDPRGFAEFQRQLAEHSALGFGATRSSACSASGRRSTI